MSRHPIFRTLFCCLLLLPPCLKAETPETGVYVREGGSGTLIVTGGKAGRHFSLDAVGVNAHSCGLEGEIADGRAVLREAGMEGACIVTFTPQAKGIDVQGNDSESGGETGACRYYCGMRASFGGLYLKPQTGCTPDELRQTREDFKKLYDSRKYRQALSALEPALTRCAETLHELYEEGSIRNDLAVTWYHLGDYGNCRALLEPYAEDAAAKDSEIEAYSYAPSDRDAYLAIIAAARVNLSLCDRAEKAARKKTGR